MSAASDANRRVRFAEILFRLQRGADLRDYRDAHEFLAAGYDLTRGLSDARALHGAQGARVVAMAKALCDFTDPAVDAGLSMRMKADLIGAVEAFARNPGLPESDLRPNRAKG